MINWNDIRVEEEIARERYEAIVRGRQVARSRPQIINPANRIGHYVRLRNWLGEHLINWGCQVKAQCQAA